MAWGLPDPVKATSTSSPTLKPTSGPITDVEEVDIFENTPLVDEIQLNGLVLLQILKHCHDNAPKCVSGSLLGLENDQALEVTASYPSLEVSSDVSKQMVDEYQIEMMKNFREVNVDNNKVGWYQSALLGTFCNAQMIEYQLQYHKMLGPNAICIIYDPAQTTKGSLCIKAYRLSREFCKQHKEGVFNKNSVESTDIRFEDVMQEIPIKIHNNDLVSCWLHQNVKQPEKECNFDQLDLSSNSFLESSLYNASAWVDEFAQEQYKFQSYDRTQAKQRQQWLQKRKEENKSRLERGLEPLPEEDASMQKSVQVPSRLESLLISKQINTYCEQINRFAGKSFEKLFVAGSLQKQ